MGPGRQLAAQAVVIITETISLAQKFQVITLTGPRQSGKTTLVKAAFSTLPYVSLEEPDIRQIALTDPRSFLANYPAGAILDEVQHTPELFSYIQSLVDEDPEIRFILTGTSNFLLMEKISQTLAGRTAILHLLPFSIAELTANVPAFERYEIAAGPGFRRGPIFDLAFTGSAKGDHLPADENL